MGDLDRDTGVGEAVQQHRGVLDRHAEAERQGGGGEQRRGRQQVDRLRRARMAPPPGDGAACGEPSAFQLGQPLQAVGRLAGKRVQEHRHPGLPFPRHLGAECAGAGERQGRPEQALAAPVPDQGGAERGAAAARVEPGVRVAGRREQRRSGAVGMFERSLGTLDQALLVEVGCREPAVQGQGMARGVEDGAAVDDAERAVHAQAQALLSLCFGQCTQNRAQSAY